MGKTVNRKVPPPTLPKGGDQRVQPAFPWMAFLISLPQHLWGKGIPGVSIKGGTDGGLTGGRHQDASLLPRLEQGFPVVLKLSLRDIGDF